VVEVPCYGSGLPLDSPHSGDSRSDGMTDTTADPAGDEREPCPYCGEAIPAGAFCGNCGAHLADESGAARLQHFAAAPTEHVVKMAIISTLFPHLTRSHAHVFRETLGIGFLAIVVLAALRLYAPSLVVAAGLMPVLYLLYMFESRIWEEAAPVVLAATFITSGVLGAAFSLGFGQLVSGRIDGTAQGAGFSGVLLPGVGQLLMLAGPLLLLRDRHFDEVLDGLSFGVMSAFGFTVASVIAGYWSTLTAPLVGPAAISTGQMADIVRAGVLAGLVNASTTGLVLATIWVRYHGRARGRHRARLFQWQEASAVAFAAQIGLGLATYYITSLALVLVVWAAAAAALLVWLRVILHFALLDEGSAHFVGDPSGCTECHRLVPAMHFCPDCGVARSAAPKHGRPPELELR